MSRHYIQMKANKTNSRINPSKTEGFNFREQIKRSPSKRDVDSIVIAARREGIDKKAPKAFFKLKALAKRRVAALSK
jgi:hypothetical protein